MQKILVVDDDAHIRDVVCFALRRAGYQPLTAGNGRAALEVVAREMPALVVLDILMPELDGTAVCTRLRAKSDLPVIFLTSKDDEMDRVLGLEIGADDYVVKPFSPRELVARVKAVLRRQERGFERQEVVEAGDLRVDSRTREVWVRERPIELSTLEFKLLHFLASNPRHVFSREELLDEVWGRDRFVTPRNVDVHVRRLREKIEAFPDKPQYLQTV